jgi:pyrimidine deaminase RibD-like protein
MGGDLNGDWYQTGGTIVVQPGNVVSFSFKQDSPADHAEVADILKALNLEPNSVAGVGGGQSGASEECGEGCARPGACPTNSLSLRSERFKLIITPKRKRRCPIKL